MLAKVAIRIVVTVVVLAIAALLGKIFTAYLKRRAKALDVDGCVACGSSEVVRDGATLRCTKCGYTGRADGGGTLSVEEMRSIRAPDDQR